MCRRPVTLPMWGTGNRHIDVGCLGSIGRSPLDGWVPAYEPGWRATASEGSLSPVLGLAGIYGEHAFTAQDLRRSCAAWIEAALPADARRHLHRAINERRSGRAIAALTLLSALCGWISGGDVGARLAVIGAVSPQGAPPTTDAMRRRPDACRLTVADAPELIALVYTVCRRAGLRRMPEVYVLPAERAMNAYALGNPDDAAVTLTSGLLDGMTRDEVAAIVAHEIAHICNGDASTMAVANGLLRMIRLQAASSYASLTVRFANSNAISLACLLQAAPLTAELLCLALSRIRELAADAFALDLIADPRTLASALEKLERHHRGMDRWLPHGDDNGFAGYLRSHPSTDQRVGFVHALA